MRVRGFFATVALAFVVAWVGVPALASILLLGSGGGSPVVSGSTFSGTCDAQSGCSLFYGTIAPTAALATTSTHSYDYSCTGGSPSTGTVNMTASGYSSQAIWQSGGACNHAVVTSTISGTVMTVSAITSGTLAVNDFITGTNVAPGNYITSLGTGTGGTGTYNLKFSSTVSVGETITAYLPIVLSKVYAQVGSTACAASSSCDMTTWFNGRNLIANAQNGHDCFGFGFETTSGGWGHGANNFTPTQPLGLSVVGNVITLASIDFFFGLNGNAGTIGFTATSPKALINSGTQLNTATGMTLGTTYTVIGGSDSVNTSSNIEFFNTAGGAVTANGAAGTTVTANLPELGQFATGSSVSLVCEAGLWNNNTAFNNTNFATTAASVKSQQVTNWGL